MLIKATDPKNTPRFAAYTPSDQAPEHFIRLHSIGHYDAVDTYQTEREDFAELLLVYTLSGEGQLEYEGAVHELKRGAVFLIDCRNWQRYKTVGSHWEFLWIHFDGPLAFAYARDIADKRGPVLPGSAEYSALWQAVFDLSRQNDLRAQAAISAKLYQLLTLCLLSAPRDGRVEQAIRYIQDHYREPVPVEALARQAGMSPFYFQRRFKEETGLSPHLYLCHHRISQAKQLLVTTSRPIADIARETGFSSSSHFTDAFKAMTGYTPKEYRKML